MKLKYYLRGMGIGIIVTTIILAISFSQREVEISDEQVMVRAAALGMVMPEEKDTPPEKESEFSTETEREQTLEPTQAQEKEEAEGTEETASWNPKADQADGAEEPTADGGVYRLEIRKGDVCRVVCERLEENGVIDNAEALRTHLFQLGYANSISVGEYDVPYGLSMEQVAEIIVAGPLAE